MSPGRTTVPRAVLEIGCGRGEFLALLCAEAGCRGVGCDPAWNPAERSRQAQ